MSVLSILLMLAALHMATVKGHCYSYEFECDNGRCLHYSDRCNGYYDCGYADCSDEHSCTSCYSYEYRCDDGDCIPEDEKCDGHKDCSDNSDESNCSLGTSLGISVGVAVVIILCIVFCFGGCCCGGHSYYKTRVRRQRVVSVHPVPTVAAVTAPTSPPPSHVPDYSDELQRAKAGYPPPYTPTVVSNPPWFQQASYPQQAWVSSYPSCPPPPPPPPPPQ